MEPKKPTVPKVPVVKAARVEPVPVIKPTVVNLAADIDNSADMSKETSENVMKVYEILEEIGSFPFYHFITDPNSFARTVENLFYVSFLIRDCRARIFIPEIAVATNELYLEAILDEEEQSLNAPGNLNQMVLVMTPKIWRKSIEKYKIETAFLDLS
jgi:non-structural maintenance of chromosomes element 4